MTRSDPDRPVGAEESKAACRPLTAEVRAALVPAIAGDDTDQLVFTGERRGNALRRGVVRRGWFDAALLATERGLPIRTSAGTP